LGLGLNKVKKFFLNNVKKFFPKASYTVQATLMKGGGGDIFLTHPVKKYLRWRREIPHKKSICLDSCAIDVLNTLMGDTWELYFLNPYLLIFMSFQM